MLNQNDILLESFDNQITCHVKVTSDAKVHVVAYLLINVDIPTTEQQLKKRYSNLDSYQFKIKRNGSYRVTVFYKDEKGLIQRTQSRVIKMNLIEHSPEFIRSLVSIRSEKNKIAFDAKDLIDTYKLVKCDVILDNKLIFESESTVFVHKISETGTYRVEVFIEDFNGKIKSVSYELYVEYKELVSKEVVGKIEETQRTHSKLIINIIYAFVIREFQRKYDKGYFRYFSIILGPTVQLGIMVTIFTLMGRKVFFGLSIPVFILTGLLPYGFFTSAGNCLTIVSGNRSLLNYKQVKIIDTMLSSILMELMVTTFVFAGGILICWYLRMHVFIYNPLSLILSFFLLFLLTFGVAMILCVVGFYFAEFNYAIQVIFRALFYISGVFFSVESIPVQYQKYVLWNPLLQIIEFIRFSFVGFKLPHELSYLYLCKCTIIIFLSGISLYFINRNKFMINDRAR